MDCVHHVLEKLLFSLMENQGDSSPPGETNACSVPGPTMEHNPGFHLGFQS